MLDGRGTRFPARDAKLDPLVFQGFTVRWSPKSGPTAKLATNDGEDEQRGWQTEELQRRVQGEGGPRGHTG